MGRHGRSDQTAVNDMGKATGTGAQFRWFSDDAPLPLQIFAAMKSKLSLNINQRMCPYIRGVDALRCASGEREGKNISASPTELPGCGWGKREKDP